MASTHGLRRAGGEQARHTLDPRGHVLLHDEPHDGDPSDVGYAGSLGAGAMVMGIIGGLMNNADAMDLHVTVSLFFPTLISTLPNL